MKAWKKIQYKYLFSSKPESEAVTPVVGSLLMLLILVVLASTVAISFFSIAEKGGNLQSLVAKISLESCEGGLPNVNNSEKATFEENRITLMHEGGNLLPLDAISIKIYGYGKSYHGIPGYGGSPLKGNISVLYLDLSPVGKNSIYYVANNNAILEDGSWSVGERLILCGQDSAVGTTKSSVKVNVDGNDNTSDNYGFKVGSEIIIKVIDTESSNVIAEQRVIVKHYEG
jgi:Protein of unknown function (DUF1628).